jgi:hypothetical protein
MLTAVPFLHPAFLSPLHAWHYNVRFTHGMNSYPHCPDTSLLSRNKRVVLTHRRSVPSGATSQATALQAEGVTVITNAMGELLVDFGEYGWFPRLLPSDAATGVEPSDSEVDEE